MKKRKKIIISIIISLCCIFMSGCWDKVEIDRKIFVVGLGVDAGKDIKKEGIIKSSELQFPTLEEDMKRLRVTYSFPDLKKIKESTAETESIAVDAYSLSSANNKATTKSSRALYMGHTKLLMLGNEIFQYKDTVKEIVDYIERHPSLSRNIYVLVCDGRAEDYIKFKPPIEKNIETYVTGLIDNNQRNNVIQELTLNEFLLSLSENGSVIIPMMSMDTTNKEIEMNKVAIVKDYVIIGELNEEDISTMQISKGKMKGGKRVIIYKKHPVDYIINGSERKIKFGRKNGKMVFNIDIKLEGRMNSHGLDMNLLSQEEMDNIEKGFDKTIKDQCERFIQVSKEKYKGDFIGLKEYVKKYHPEVFKEIEKNWDEEYVNSIINVNIESDIRRIGVIK
ncbi:Ger(x)C family spore germination protein [Haloimpatiens massiliensis]|uniref:Ger(x)C family spore germination protein n=1 Tax=Haloimpatiens massiliensis TaxID=1658110 RepID=UPI000C82601A|nr:Ger(x)C family spore germination protein [Haloimpatiens massiliensis]